MVCVLLTFMVFFSDSEATVIVQSSQKLFESAVSFSSAPDGMIYVADQKLNAVVQVSPFNEIVRTVGGKGWGKTEFDLPVDVASSFLLDLFVVDGNNRRIQRFDKQFNFIQSFDETSIPQLNGRFIPRACNSSSLGDLFVIDQDENRIVKISQRGLFELEFGTYKDGKQALVDPQDIVVSPQDEILVLDKEYVVQYDRFGNFIRRVSLPQKGGWRSISISDNILCIVSPKTILLINMLTQERHTINGQSFIGSKINEPFIDAVVQDSILVVISSTTIYRCTFPSN